MGCANSATHKCQAKQIEEVKPEPRPEAKQPSPNVQEANKGEPCPQGFMDEVVEENYSRLVQNIIEDHAKIAP